MKTRAISNPQPNLTRFLLACMSLLLAAAWTTRAATFPAGFTYQGFLTGTVDRNNHFADDDIRATIPRFSRQNRDANQALVDHVRALASQRNATPGQVALAWLLARHPSIVPIPGTRSIKRIDENTHAASLPLSADDIADLNALTSRVQVHGNRYNDHHMTLVGQ